MEMTEAVMTNPARQTHTTPALSLPASRVNEAANRATKLPLTDGPSSGEYAENPESRTARRSKTCGTAVPLRLASAAASSREGGDCCSDQAAGCATPRPPGPESQLTPWVP